MARIVLWSLAAAVAVFCLVQDRVTAAAARRYVQLHREAASSGRSGPSLDDVMRPAVRQSVWYGLLSGGATAGVGLGAGVAAGWRTRRE